MQKSICLLYTSPYCGAPVSKAQDFVNKAGEAFNAAVQELGSAFDEVKQSFTGNSANQQNAGGQYNGCLLYTS